MVSEPQPIGIEIIYCDPSECPGCPPPQVCDCAPSTIAVEINQPGETSNSGTIISEPIGTPPIEREIAMQGIAAKPSKKWYKYRPNPRRNHHHQLKPCPSNPIPVEPQPCECPLISCAAPPECIC